MSGDFHGFAGLLDGRDPATGPFPGNGQCNRAAAGTEVGDPGLSVVDARQLGQGEVDDSFGLGTRNQYASVDGQVEALAAIATGLSQVLPPDADLPDPLRAVLSDTLVEIALRG